MEAWVGIGYLPPPKELRDEEDEELERPKPPELRELPKPLEEVPVRLAKDRCDCLGLETIFARAACLLAFGDTAADLIGGVPCGMAGDMPR